MDITLNVKLLKSLLAKKIDSILTITYWDKQKLDLEIGSEKGFEEKDAIKFNLVDVSDKSLPLLLEILGENDAPKKTVETVRRWIEV